MLLAVSLTFSVGMQGANLTAAQKQEATAKINKAASALKSMECSFVQTKHLKMLNDKMVSKGKMFYKQPDKLRWEYTSPYQYQFIFNGTKVYVGGKNRKDVIDTNSNKVFKEVARIMMSTVTGKALNSSADFDSDVADAGTFWKVTLTPKKKDIKQMFTKIELMFAKSNTMISSIDIYEKNGDRTNIKLNDIKTNGTINESLFAIPK